MFRRKKTESFTLVSLSVSSMRNREIYEITDGGDLAVLKLYTGFFARDEKPEPDKEATCDKESIIRLLNDCDVLSWDGFSGKNPRGVRDGYMFTFKAELNGGTKVYASGSNNFPKHYRELRDNIIQILNGR